MSPQPAPEPKKQTGPSPTIFYVIIAIVVLSIAAFFILRPAGTNPGRINPSAPPRAQY